MKNPKHSSNRKQPHAIFWSPSRLAARLRRLDSLPFIAAHRLKPAGILRSAACASAIALLLVFASSAHAQTTWIVNTTVDSHDTSCTTTTCSLRDALSAANAGDTINFSVNGTITLSGELNISSNVTIQGSGVTVSGNHAYPVFVVPSGVTATISGLTIANGNGGSAYGGGISNGGTLTVTGSTFSGNSVGFSQGGAIYNSATLLVTNSTFSGNSAYYGGGIMNDSGGALTVTNSTFSANSGSHGGGALFNLGTLTVTNSIFSGNTSPNFGGIVNQGPHASESNNLFFNNSGGDSEFALSSTDLTGQDPKLAPLSNYGGPTQTMLPLPGSAAICAGSSSALLAGVTTDQRGFPRLNTTYSGFSAGSPCLDIGAVQTNYQSIQFTNGNSGYSASVDQFASPAPNVSVTENGQNIGGVPVTLTFSGSGTAGGLGPVATVAGTGASFNGLSVDTAGTGTLSATLNLNPTGSLSITTDPTAVLTIMGTVTVSINDIPASPTYNGSFTPTYTLTPTGSTGTAAGDNGVTSVASLNTSVCGVLNGTVYFVGVGTCTLQASIAATTDYSAATGMQQSFSVGPAPTTVSINNIPTTAIIGGSFTPRYTVTSGDFGFTTSVVSLNTSVCEVANGTVSFVGVGTCNLQAQLSASPLYAAASSQQNFSIVQPSATVSISNVPTMATYGGSFTPTYSVTPSGDTGPRSVTSLTTNTCTVNGGTVSFVGAGTCNLQAAVAATSNYLAGTGSPQSFSIGKANPAVSISNIPALPIYGNSFTPLYAVTSGDTGSTSVTSLTTNTCTVTAGTVSFVGAGTCNLQASVAATTNYAGAMGSQQSFTIGKASATVSISNIPATAIIGSNFTPTYSITPSTDTGAATSVTSLTTNTCTVTGETVTFVGVGTCNLQASVASTTDYALGTSQQSLKITYGTVAQYSQTMPSASGSTIPIKVQLTNYSGANLSSSKTGVTVTGISPSPAPGKAPSGNFTFMSTSDAGPMYQLNVKTTGYPRGTYILSFTVSGDPITHTVGFVIQ